MVPDKWVITPRQKKEEWSNQPMRASINREPMSGRPTWKERHPEVSNLAMPESLQYVLNHCMTDKILGANFILTPER